MKLFTVFIYLYKYNMKEIFYSLHKKQQRFIITLLLAWIREVFSESFNLISLNIHSNIFMWKTMFIIGQHHEISIFLLENRACLEPWKFYLLLFLNNSLIKTSLHFIVLEHISKQSQSLILNVDVNAFGLIKEILKLLC